MNEIFNVAGKEIVRREIMELCREAEPYGAGTPVLKAALRKTGHDLTDQELMRQVDYLEGKGLVHKEMVENRRLGISRCIVRLSPEGPDYLEGTGPDVAGGD